MIIRYWLKKKGEKVESTFSPPRWRPKHLSCFMYFFYIYKFRLNIRFLNNHTLIIVWNSFLLTTCMRATSHFELAIESKSWGLRSGLHLKFMPKCYVNVSNMTGAVWYMNKTPFFLKKNLVLAEKLKTRIQLFVWTEYCAVYIVYCLLLTKVSSLTLRTDKHFI